MQPDLSQKSFAAGLLSPGIDLPEGVVDPDGRPAPKRYAVYRNNVTVSLIEAIVAGYPAVQALVGEAFFRAMARQFVRSHPPCSPLLMDYGAGFAEFIENYAPARPLPFLPDVARLERAWLDAFHSADAVPLAANRLAGLGEADLARSRLVAHPATRLVVSRFAVFDLWRAGRGMRDIADIDPGLAQAALVVRPEVVVDVLGLSRGGASFAARLMAGADPVSAAGDALAAEPEFDLAAALATMLSAGAFADIETLREDKR